MVHHIESFFGCYLLYCKNPKYKGRTYIGFTVNPKRRITQHNAGKHKGGAWRTSGRGPWDMTLIVHGFPSDIAALRFEWAWQHPESSRRLKHISGKSRKETAYQYRIRILSHMLCERPWSILPLTVRWLKQEYCTEFDPSPPTHIPIAFGPVEVKVNKTQKRKEIPGNKKSQADYCETPMNEEAQENDTKYISLLERMEKKLKDLEETEKRSMPKNSKCILCFKLILNGSPLTCTEGCDSCYHTQCLAEHFLKDNIHEIIPIEGPCPTCNKVLLWGDLVRKSKGFHQYLGEGDID